MLSIWVSPHSCISQVFLAINLFHRPHLILANLYRMVDEIDRRNRVAVWSYYALLLCITVTILRSLCLMFVRTAQDYGWVHLFFYDYLDNTLHWTWPTKMFLFMIDCHVMLCFHLILKTQPQLFTALRAILHDSKDDFFPSPRYKGKPVVERVQRVSLSYLKALATFPMILSE